MSLDWLKIEINTPDKPEVLALTEKMKWPDLDTTVGKLIRFWGWFDQHTNNGYARGVTDANVFDRICGAPGFGQALVDVGWLLITKDGAALPNFDRHNGKTAKQRALTARRMYLLRFARNNSKHAAHKSDAPSDAPSDALGVTFENQEEVEEVNTLSTRTKPKVKGFMRPTLEEVRAEITAKGYQIDAERFIAFYESKGWKVGNQPMKSWKAALVTWVKRDSENRPPNAGALNNRGQRLLSEARERLSK